jgi:HlyD family secretion protein
VEINAEVGSLVKMGERILTIESETAELKAVCYTPAIAGGKKIKRGMKVQISPSTVKSSDYGFIIGKVQSVSHIPASNDRMRDLLKNEKLIEQFTRSGAPFEIVVLLEPAQTPSGYKWTSSKGPPISIDSGTLCNAFVIVARKRPIEYVIPIFNEIINFFRD